jgi:hypothetical protein
MQYILYCYLQKLKLQSNCIIQKGAKHKTRCSKERLLDVVAEFPFAGGVWAATVGGFASEKVEDGGGGGLVLLPPVPVSKNGYISYRTVQLPNSA